MHMVMSNIVSGPSNFTSILGVATTMTTSSVTDYITEVPLDKGHICMSVLFKTIGASQVGIWDLMLLIPNILFLLFLIFKSRDAVAILVGQNYSPIFIVIFALIFVSVCMSIMRCVISMVINSTGDLSTVDRIMWLIHRFFLLATELSVVTFGLLFVHLDSRTSVRKIIAVAFSLSLIYSACQGALEFVYNDDTFHTDMYTLFGHGGLIFWFTSSLFLFLIYAIICCLPYTGLAQRLTLPARRSFYVYCLILAVLDITQAIGSIVLFQGHKHALCVLDVTAYLYFTCFAPLVYVIFLHGFLRSNANEVPIIYGSQTEDDDCLPHQPILYEHLDSDAAVDMGNDSFDSTHFGCPSPLYAGLSSRPEVSVNADLRFNVRPGIKV